jgi:Fic family protein
MKTPRVRLTESIFALCSDIERLLGRYEGLTGVKPQPKLRRLNRIRTVQGSLAIEGNSLSVDQVTAVLEGKRVLGLQKEIAEVRNANAAYELAKEFDPYAIRFLLRAHGILMQGLIPDAGNWRTGAVGILKGSALSHLAPKPRYVQGLVKDLVSFIRKSKTTPLILSSVFHHEFEMIHPFSDGNGRMGRLWQHVLLVRFHPLFEFVPVESIIRERQQQYYEALEAADRATDSTPFVEFMLEAILHGTEELLGELRVGPMTPDDRLRAAHEQFLHEWFSRKDYQTFFVRLSAPTASRDLKFGVVRKQLERRGDKALSRYRFKLG